MEPLLINTREAAKRLGVSESWLKHEVAAYAVAHTRLGRAGRLVKFSQANLEEIVAAGAVEPVRRGRP